MRSKCLNYQGLEKTKPVKTLHMITTTVTASLATCSTVQFQSTFGVLKLQIKGQFYYFVGSMQHTHPSDFLNCSFLTSYILVAKKTNMFNQKGRGTLCLGSNLENPFQHEIGHLGHALKLCNITRNFRKIHIFTFYWPCLPKASILCLDSLQSIVS